MSNPRPTCGPIEGFVLPGNFLLMCMCNKMTTGLYFDNNPKFDIFDAMVFSACLSFATHW